MTATSGWGRCLSMGLALAAAGVAGAAEPAVNAPAATSWTRQALSYRGPGTLFVLEDGSMVLRFASPSRVAAGAPLAYGLRTTADALVERAPHEWELGRGKGLAGRAERVAPLTDTSTPAALLELDGDLQVDTDVGAALVRVALSGEQGAFTGRYRVPPVAAVATEEPAESDGIDLEDWGTQAVLGCSVSCGANGMCFASGRFAICFCGLTGPVCISSLIR